MSYMYVCVLSQKKGTMSKKEINNKRNISNNIN